MSVELTIETVEETIVLELQDHVPAVLTIDHIPDLRDELDSKVDKVEGYSLVDDDEIAKLVTVQENATANRADSLNADKVHGHVIADVAGLAAKLELINQWLQVPADKKYFDFVGNRYSADGVPATVSSLSQFTRLSAATQWKDGALVDVAANVMRLDKAKGLLIEKSSTELIPNNSIITSTNTAWTGIREPDGSLNLTSNGSTSTTTLDIPVYPNGNVGASSGSYRRAILVKKGSGHIYFGAASSLTAMIVNLSSGVPEFVGGEILQHSVVDIGSYWYIQHTAASGSATRRSFSIQATDNGYTVATLNTPSAGFSITIAYPSFMDTTFLSQTVIKTSGTPVTRAKDTLVVPFTAGQTVTADKDVGVTMTITGTNAVFEGHGYIRNVRVN